MKIKLNRAEAIANLPHIVKIPAIINFNKQDFSFDIDKHNLCDFGWADSIEESILGDGNGESIWMLLYDGVEVEIPKEIELYWNSLLNIDKSNLSIKNIKYENNIYKAEINNRKVTIEIKYDE